MKFLAEIIAILLIAVTGAVAAYGPDSVARSAGSAVRAFNLALQGKP